MRPYVHYFDSDMANDNKTYLKRANADYAQKAEDDVDNLEEIPKTPVEIYRRKINDNLKILNMKTTNIIQDGLNGVESICNKVRECLKDGHRYMDKRGRGDIMESAEENKSNSTEDALFLLNSNADAVEYSADTLTNKKITPPEHIEEDLVENVTETLKNDKSAHRPTSDSSKAKKKIPKCKKQDLTSHSCNAAPETKESGGKGVKRKLSSTTKKQPEAESETPTSRDKEKPEPTRERTLDGISAKKRLGQIEKDYEKVVQNLRMVEQMMASINRKISTSETQPEVKAKPKEKLHKAKSSPAEENLRKIAKKESPKAVECQQKTKTDDRPVRKQKVVDRDWLNEVRKKKKISEVEEKEDGSERIGKRAEDMEKVDCRNVDPETLPNTFSSDIDKDDNNSQEIAKLSHPSKVKLTENMSDLDALIDNAVLELGNIVSDFNSSQNSSDVSFKITTFREAKNRYAGYLQDTSSSSFSGCPLGEDSPKFEISKSFQELKESYLRDNPLSTKSARKDNRKIRVEKCKKAGPNNIDHLPTEARNKTNNEDSKQINFVKSLTSQNSTIANISDKSDQNDEAKANVYGNLVNYDVMDAIINYPMRKGKFENEEKDIITISMPLDKQLKSSSKCKKTLPTIKNVNTAQLDEDTIQITVTLTGDSEDRHKNKKADGIERIYEKEIEGEIISENEFGECLEDFEYDDREEINTKKEPRERINERVNCVQKSKRLDEKRKWIEEEEDEYAIFSSENATANNGRTRYRQPEFKAKKKEFHRTDVLTSSGSSSTTQLWSEYMRTQDIPIDHTKQISLQCKKMIGDLVVEDDVVCIEKLMKGSFNSTLIETTINRFKRARSVRLNPVVQDPDLKDLEPNVHRNMAVPDLHNRMEDQIRQTDSFHGFLNLMDKNRRKALIKHAERQDHNYRCQMKPCFRKKYPFKVVTASVPPNFDVKSKDKKDPEKKYINSLWFSPKDFKLRRNSRIFNKKRLEIYCQSLHKAPLISRCKCKEAEAKESKHSTKASNYNILVRSGTPLGRRPNTPTRGANAHSAIIAGSRERSRLRHCDILDDLTLKDLAPFKSEYFRLSEINTVRSLEDSLLNKLAYGENLGNEGGTLTELLTPRLSCTQTGCKACKPKVKHEKKHSKRQKTPNKLGNETTTPKNDELQTLTPKAAAKLLIQNIGEIKSRKNSPKSPTSEKCLAKCKEMKKKRSMKSIGKNSKKALTQESKSTIYQKIEENLVKNILNTQRAPTNKFAQRAIVSRPASSVKEIDPFKGIEGIQPVIKIPEFHHKPTCRNPAVTKLFPYINDPENKVFQNITVLPVKILYENETLNDTSKNTEEHICGDGVANSSRTDQTAVVKIDQRKLSPADDCAATKIGPNRRRYGSPKRFKNFSSQDSKKTAALPPKLIGSSAPVNEIPHPADITCAPNDKEDNSINNQTAKVPPAKSKFRKCSSFGKTTENENVDFKNYDQQHFGRRSFNPNPWKPSCRLPESVPFAKSPLRMKSKDVKHNQAQPPKTPSASKITVKEENNGDSVPNAVSLMQKIREKCYNTPRRPMTSQITSEISQTKILVNKDKKIKFEVKPAKLFYEIDNKGNRLQGIKASRNYATNPTHKAMVEHLCALRNRNVKLQGSIQKAINIIEEKMVDVLSTKDHYSKKKTIERMEKEINNVLKMINEQSYKIKETGGMFDDKCQEGVVSQPQNDNGKGGAELTNRTDNIPVFTQPVIPNTAVYSLLVENEERSLTDAKALVMHIPPVKTTKPPRKRATSRLLKLQSQPSTVEEESRSNHSEEDFEQLDTDENPEEEANEDLPEKSDDVVRPENQTTIEELKEVDGSLESYSSAVIEGPVTLCPLLPCPTPIPSLACHNLSHKAQKAIKKMSMKAFGHFADVVKTKTRLIINMTERIDVEEPNLLSHPPSHVTSNLPAVLAQSKVPETTEMPCASDVISNTSHPFVTVPQETTTCVVNTIADILSPACTEILTAGTKEIAEFGNIPSDRSITSFSESECFYTWPGPQRTSGINSEDSTCAITHKMMRKDCLTPFMRALSNLRTSRIFENRHQLIPLEETSPSFTRLMDLLEGLSNINNRLNQKALREVQLMWNPERRCSFHSSMKCSKGISYATDTKAVSAHSIVTGLTSSSSETFFGEKLQEYPSKTDISKFNNQGKYEETDGDKEDSTEKFETEVTKEIREIYKLPKQTVREVECEILEKKSDSINLVLSEIHLISIPHTQSYSKELELEDMTYTEEEFSISNRKTSYTMNKNRYETFLKFFYLIFYGLMYFCMTAMNFTC